MSLVSFFGILSRKVPPDFLSVNNNDGIDVNYSVHLYPLNLGLSLIH